MSRPHHLPLDGYRPVELEVIFCVRGVMTAAFAAALVEGFEGALDVALEQIDEGKLGSEVEALRIHITWQRQRFEEQEALELMTSVP